MNWGQLKRELANVSDDTEIKVSVGNPLVSVNFEIEEVFSPKMNILDDNDIYLLVFAEDKYGFSPDLPEEEV